MSTSLEYVGNHVIAVLKILFQKRARKLFYLLLSKIQKAQENVFCQAWILIHFRILGVIHAESGYC
jgi:hypothetical protein